LALRRWVDNYGSEGRGLESLRVTSGHVWPVHYPLSSHTARRDEIEG